MANGRHVSHGNQFVIYGITQIKALPYIRWYTTLLYSRNRLCGAHTIFHHRNPTAIREAVNIQLSLTLTEIPLALKIDF